MCVFLWLWIYSTSLFFITTIFSLYNSTAAHSSKQKSEKTDVSLYCRETLLFSAAAYHLFKINMALATAVDGVQIKKYYFKKERESACYCSREEKGRKKERKKKLDICLERCLCFFPFIWRETRGINFRENDQGVVKYIVYTHTHTNGSSWWQMTTSSRTCTAAAFPSYQKRKKISCWANIRRGFHLPFNSATLTEMTRRNNTHQQHQNKLKKKQKKTKRENLFPSSFLTLLYERRSCCGKRVKKKNLSRKSLGYAVATPLLYVCVHSTV